MISDKTYSITPVANGWIITIPYNRSFPAPIDIAEQARIQARAIKDEFQKDAFLDSIIRESEEAEAKFKGDHQEKRESSVFVFHSTDDMLAFLSIHFNTNNLT